MCISYLVTYVMYMYCVLCIYQGICTNKYTTISWRINVYVPELKYTHTLNAYYTVHVLFNIQYPGDISIHVHCSTCHAIMHIHVKLDKKQQRHSCGLCIRCTYSWIRLATDDGNLMTIWWWYEFKLEWTFPFGNVEIN